MSSDTSHPLCAGVSATAVGRRSRAVAAAAALEAAAEEGALTAAGAGAA